MLSQLSYAPLFHHPANRQDNSNYYTGESGICQPNMKNFFALLKSRFSLSPSGTGAIPG
jgi:hypothetical protein